jgi:pimeloyl-ACP methyl ester carboxylesterase
LGLPRVVAKPGYSCQHLSMAQAQLSPELAIEYDTFGDPADPAIILIMGLGTQMIAWHVELCAQIAAKGFYVVRYDNRDVGLSSKLDHKWPGVLISVVKYRLGLKIQSPYLLTDMAADAIGLLDHLGIDRAHFVGASMGGMIAQELALGWPERTLSLTSIMSTTGSRSVGQSERWARKLLLAARPDGREATIEANVKHREALSGKFFDEDGVRVFVTASYDRSHRPEAYLKHLTAVVASGDRTVRLRGLDTPSLVMHGDQDGLVGFDGGLATAEAIPGARFVALEGMGHGLPHEMWPEIIGNITEHASAATS